VDLGEMLLLRLAIGKAHTSLPRGCLYLDFAPVKRPALARCGTANTVICFSSDER
jgi:hypothetical protein